MSDLQVTNLELIMEVPWQDHFQLGYGVNAISGKMASRALKHIGPLQPSDLEGENADYKIIHNLDDQHFGSRVNTNATINLGFPAALGAKFDYNHLSADSLSSYFIDYWIEGHYGLERVDPHVLELTPEAKGYVRNPARFREKYGDYFVCGFRRYYSFHCIVQCKEGSNVHARDIGAGASVSLGSLFGIGSDAGVSRSSEGVQGVESVRSFCNGCFPKSSTMSSTPFEANSLEHAVNIDGEVKKLDISERPGVRLIALLQHYSTLDETSLPTKVPVHRDVFSELHRMDNLYMNLELKLSHPAIDIEDLPDVSSAIELFRSGRDTFVNDRDAREEAFHKLQGATQQLKKFLELSKHRLRISSLLSNKNPPTTLKDKAGKAHAEFGYRLAYSEQAISDVKCRPVRLEHGLDGWECLLVGEGEKREWNVLSQHYKTNLYFHRRPTRKPKTEPKTEYSPEFNAAIVGFSLSCDNAPDESVAFTVVTGDLLSSSLSVQVSAPYGRVWHCRIFFIEDEFGCVASRNPS